MNRYNDNSELLEKMNRDLAERAKSFLGIQKGDCIGAVVGLLADMSVSLAIIADALTKEANNEPNDPEH